MASCAKVFYGAWVGPGPSYFRVVAEVWDYGDTGTGHNLRLRRWVQVNDGGNFGGTIVATAWNGYVTLYGSGTYYGLTETENYHIKYGEPFGTPSEYIAASYNSYDSRTSVSYTVPKPTYAVSYNANGGSGAPSAQTKTYGTNLTLSKTIPTRTGYTFKNWNTKKDGSGTNYAPGGTYSSNSAVTLYAQWTVITYTVSYNANGGTGAPESQMKTYGEDLTLSDVIPARSGCAFLGWATSDTAEEPEYLSGGTYTENADITLYAVWKWKGGMCLYQNGQARKGRPCLYQNGTKRAGIPWMKVNGVWKKGV